MDDESNSLMKIGSYKIKQILGQGSFGKVYKSYSKKKDRKIALKVLDKSQFPKAKIDFMKKEPKMMMKIRHPNILRCYRTEEDQDCVYIELELMEGGDLGNDIKQRRKQGNYFAEQEARDIVKGILMGLGHIHGLNILHRDLKPANLLLKEKGDYSNIKIADFGLSGQYTKNSLSKSLSKNVGTTLYMAPEQFKNQDYGKNIDIWSVGIIMWMLLGDLKHPFYRSGMGSNQFKLLIRNPSIDFETLKCSSLAKNLLAKFLLTKGSMRLGARSALSHPWITGNHLDPIPLTANEIFLTSETKSKIYITFKMLKFLANLRSTEGFHERIKLARSKRNVSSIIANIGSDKKNNNTSSSSFDYESSTNNYDKEYSEMILKPQPIASYKRRFARSKNMKKIDFSNLGSLRRKRKMTANLDLKNQDANQKKRRLIKLKSVNVTPLKNKAASPVRATCKRINHQILRSIKSHKAVAQEDHNTNKFLSSTTKRRNPPLAQKPFKYKKSGSISPSKKTREYRISTVKKYNQTSDSKNTRGASPIQKKNMKRSISFSPVKRSRKMSRNSKFKNSYRKGQQKNHRGLRYCSIQDYAKNTKQEIEHFTTSNRGEGKTSLASSKLRLEEVWN